MAANVAFTRAYRLCLIPSLVLFTVKCYWLLGQKRSSTFFFQSVLGNHIDHKGIIGGSWVNKSSIWTSWQFCLSGELSFELAVSQCIVCKCAKFRTQPVDICTVDVEIYCFNLFKSYGRLTSTLCQCSISCDIRHRRHQRNIFF